MDNAYAPYSFQSDDGKLQGILVDQWQAWEKKTGIKVEIHAADWEEALRRMRAGDFDVIDSIVETAERLDYFDFTAPYATIEASIFFRDDVSGITDLASLKGFAVGAKAGDQHIDKLTANGVTSVILYRNNHAIIEAAKENTINVFLADDPSALYLLNKTGIDAGFRRSAPVFRDELRRAVRKGDAALLRTVSEGFAALPPRELKQIDEKWFGRTINRSARYLAYAVYAGAAAMLLTAGLVGWNRTLRRGILQRTAALGESERRLRCSSAELQALSRRLVELQEADRKELARELHDRVGQSLTALGINFAILRDAPLLHHDAGIRSRLEDSATLLKSTMQAIENVASDLRPPMLDDYGLRLALDWYAQQFSARAGIAVSVRASEPNQRVAAEVEIALFRIAQEALNNVAKHARASSVVIALERQESGYVMSVADDGVGLQTAGEPADRPRSGLGMVTMRERAQAIGGRFRIESLPGGGTRLTVRIAQ
jgi:signal transduction histidine kinase